MKFLSVAVPCYNSEAYMKKAIESILVAGEDVEILIVNDGSKDRTEEIAKEYEEKYPSIIKAINQKNLGHGGAVNTGLKNAKGLFFKVLDSDDWFDEDALIKIMERLKKLATETDPIDMIISNFVYEKQGQLKKKVMRYEKEFPIEKIFRWNEMKKFGIGNYLLMHSVIYRTQFLKDCNLVLPEHTFYVDNIFVFHPLQYVKNIYYIDVDLYRYFIGREDQSVNEKVMISRIDQQIKITKLMIEDTDVLNLDIKELKTYMIDYLSILMMTTSILLMKSGTEENFKKKEDIWEYLENYNKDLYKEIRYSIFGRAVNIPGKIGDSISLFGYKIARKIYGFN